MINKERKTDIKIDPAYATIREEASKTIRKLMRKHRIRGVSISLIDDQKIVWAQGFGYADVKNKIPAMASTVYRVGSISKLFTDTAVMQLVDQGKMDIDAPLTTYIPDFSIHSRFVDADPITPRNIMCHHSGLPGNYWKGMWGDPKARFSQLPSLIRNEYAAYPPNKIFSYSNLGLSLLGLAIQNVSGDSFTSYMDEHLLQPMGMQHSSFELTPTIRSLLSEGYAGGRLGSQPVLRDLPAGGLYSSVENMARFASMVFADGCFDGRQIIQARTLAEMLRPQNTNVPLDVGFHMGLGWGISDGQGRYQDSGPVIGHDGGTFYFCSLLSLMPKHKLGAVVLTNSREGASLIRKMLTQTLRLALEKKTGVPQPTENSKPVKEVKCISTEIMDSLPGYYDTMAGPVIIKTSGHHLYATFGKRKLHIDPCEDGTFSVNFRLLGIFKIRPLKNITLSFQHIEEHDVLVSHEAGRFSIFGEKVTHPVISDAWRKRLGDYEVVNPDNELTIDWIRLAERDQALQLRVRLKSLTKTASIMTLLPVSDTDAIIAGLGRARRETIYVTVRGGTEYLHYSGFECRKINAGK